jgi:hypothetical protein
MGVSTVFVTAAWNHELIIEHTIDLHHGIGASLGNVYIIELHNTLFNSLLLLPPSLHPLMKHTIG